MGGGGAEEIVEVIIDKIFSEAFRFIFWKEHNYRKS